MPKTKARALAGNAGENEAPSFVFYSINFLTASCTTEVLCMNCRPDARCGGRRHSRRSPAFKPVLGVGYLRVAPIKT